MNNELTTKAIGAVLGGEVSFCKFLSANDSGETGGHQYGILISITASAMFWTEQEMKENHILKKYGRIRWQDDYETDCTFTWYESKKSCGSPALEEGCHLSVQNLQGPCLFW